MTVVVYVYAGQGSPSGPYAWVARTVHSEDVSELAGHEKEHFSRLQIVATIAAFEALPEGSTVHLVCSDQYLITHVMGRLDALAAGTIKKSGKKAIANRDLFPALLKARNRHITVTQEVVRWEARDAEHDATAEACQRLIDRRKEGEPLPANKARPAAIMSRREMREAEEINEEGIVRPATFPRATGQGANVDVPW